MYCKKCGREVEDDAKFCPFCGENLQENTVTYTAASSYDGNSSDKSRGLAMILACIGFVFVAGIHRFYVGKIGTGILWLLTGGVFGIGTIIDVIMLATGSFTDIDGRPLTKWDLD